MGNKKSKSGKTMNKSGSMQSQDATILDENEINLIALSTKLSRDKVAQWHDKFVADYPLGYIKRDEFVRSFKSLYNFGHPEKVANFAFKLFDKDENGALSFREFLIATTFLTYNNLGPEHTKRSLELAFLIFDRDENGSIDAAEIKQLFEAINSMRKSGQPRVDATKIFKNYDVDNSASLDKDEFINALYNEKIFDVLMNEN
jgi:Ca2+-binding EF-hand superfamily protein